MNALIIQELPDFKLLRALPIKFKCLVLSLQREVSQATDNTLSPALKSPPKQAVESWGLYTHTLIHSAGWTVLVDHSKTETNMFVQHWPDEDEFPHLHPGYWIIDSASWRTILHDSQGNIFENNTLACDEMLLLR